MENLTKQFNDLMIDPKEEYSDELNRYINMHNVSVSEFAQSLTDVALLNLLVKKGIITEEEFSNEMYNTMTHLKGFETLKSNYDALMDGIRMMNEDN